MICSWASELSLLDILERKLEERITVSLLTEIERELLSLRARLDQPSWRIFCSSFAEGTLFRRLNLSQSVMRRVADIELAYPRDVLDSVMTEPFQARQFSDPCGAHIIAAWQYALPVSRSIRLRRDYFSREIAEVMRSVQNPKILVLGAGKLREADQALHSGVEVYAVFSDSRLNEILQSNAPRLSVASGGRHHLRQLRERQATFDLIYSPGWLDHSIESEAVEWLADAVELLRPNGRILASNFAPSSRDCGWVEACWNWRPQYRSEINLAHLVMNIRRPEARAMIRGHAIFRDESGASAYLDLQSI